MRKQNVPILIIIPSLIVFGLGSQKVIIRAVCRIFRAWDGIFPININSPNNAISTEKVEIFKKIEKFLKNLSTILILVRQYYRFICFSKKT